LSLHRAFQPALGLTSLLYSSVTSSHFCLYVKHIACHKHVANYGLQINALDKSKTTAFKSMSGLIQREVANHTNKQLKSNWAGDIQIYTWTHVITVV